MNIRFTLLALALMGCFAATLAAQSKRAPIFTSAYSSLAQGCKVLKGDAGTDDAFLCRGIAGYRVRIFSSAAATHITAEVKGMDVAYPIATLGIGFDESKTRLEWRMADGVPFAVIMRVPKYGEPTDDNPYFGKVIGQELIIRGLKDVEDLSLSVDAKTKDANAEARRLADDAYQKKVH